jgi:hypothetical protein
LVGASIDCTKLQYWRGSLPRSISLRMGDTGPLPGLGAGLASASGSAVNQAPVGAESLVALHTSAGQSWVTTWNCSTS